MTSDNTRRPTLGVSACLMGHQVRFDGGHKLGFTGEIFQRENDIDSRTNQGSTYLTGENSTVEHNKRQRLSADYEYLAEDSNGLIDSAHAIAYWQKLRRHDDQSGVRGARRESCARRKSRSRASAWPRSAWPSACA